MLIEVLKKSKRFHLNFALLFFSLKRKWNEVFYLTLDPLEFDVNFGSKRSPKRKKKRRLNFTFFSLIELVPLVLLKSSRIRVQFPIVFALSKRKFREVCLRYFSMHHKKPRRKRNQMKISFVRLTVIVCPARIIVLNGKRNRQIGTHAIFCCKKCPVKS